MDRKASAKRLFLALLCLISRFRQDPYDEKPQPAKRFMPSEGRAGWTMINLLITTIDKEQIPHAHL
jgi:hypothetical protein